MLKGPLQSLNKDQTEQRSVNDFITMRLTRCIITIHFGMP